MQVSKCKRPRDLKNSESFQLKNGEKWSGEDSSGGDQTPLGGGDERVIELKLELNKYETKIDRMQSEIDLLQVRNLIKSPLALMIVLSFGAQNFFELTLLFAMTTFCIILAVFLKSTRTILTLAGRCTSKRLPESRGHILKNSQFDVSFIFLPHIRKIVPRN